MLELRSNAFKSIVSDLNRPKPDKPHGLTQKSCLLPNGLDHEHPNRWPRDGERYCRRPAAGAYIDAKPSRIAGNELCGLQWFDQQTVDRTVWIAVQG